MNKTMMMMMVVTAAAMEQSVLGGGDASFWKNAKAIAMDTCGGYPIWVKEFGFGCDSSLAGYALPA